MAGDQRVSLEKALIKAESDAESLLEAATRVVRSLKKFRASARVGSLRELRRTMGDAEQAVNALKQQLTNGKEGWDFDEETYLSSNSFTAELLATAKQMGVNIFEQDDRLYCYPFLIRILPNERSVLIDKVRERRLRPSVLVSHLKELQNKPVRFKPEAFLECLFSAAVAARGKDRVEEGAVVPLLEVYDLLTLLPGQTKEYTRQEFARDIYLFDQSDLKRTKKGHNVNFPASTGTRSASRTITVITRRGQEKKYYGVSFKHHG